MLNKKTISIGHAVRDGESSRHLLFMWAQFGPYHLDRCEAVAEAFALSASVIGIEIASASTHYDWSMTGEGRGFRKRTLFPGLAWEQTGLPQRFWRLLRAVWAAKARDNFLCHYALPEVFLLAVCLRACGRRVYTMFDSKFDDRPRSVWLEALKSVMLLPYNAAFVSGARSLQYMRFFGYSPAAIALGYDTVSVARIRRLAASLPAPDGVPFAARNFTIIARLLPKKNLSMAIDAYDLYRRREGDRSRDLVLIGNGPLEAELRADVARRGLSGVVFAGFLQEEDVARALARSLALLLPSKEEQWGLVVNEALAMGLPVLASDNVGARDDLVRVGVNGYIVEPDNAEGLAYLMQRLASDEQDWRRLCAGSLALAPMGDVAHFVDAVAGLTGLTKAVG